MYRKVIITVTALIVLLLGATVVNAASQRALPGDSLYSLKTGIEDTYVTAAGSADSKAKLNMKFAQTRLDEIQKLVEQQRYDEITIASDGLENHLAQAAQWIEEVNAQDPAGGAVLSEEFATIISQQTKLYGNLVKTAPDSLKPVFQSAIDDNGNTNDVDNGNTNDDGNTNNDDDDNVNDDNGNANDDENANEDEGNLNDDGNANANDDNGNVNDDGNTNDNDDDNANSNDNDDNINDDGNTNDNDDNGNVNDDGNTNDNDDDDVNDDGNTNDDNGNENDDNANDNVNDNDNDDNENDDDDDENENDNGG
jgi:hypothetical protein